MTAQIVKHNYLVTSVDDIPRIVKEAFYIAQSGRPGPVVIALPEDMLTAIVEVEDAGPYKTVRPHPGADEMAQLRGMLAKAERSFVILGGGGWSAKAVEDIKAFIEANDLPVGCSFRCQDLFDNRSANYAGDVGIGINPKLAQRVKDAVVLLVIGARLGEMTTSAYTLVEAPVPQQTLVHVHADAEELGQALATLPPRQRQAVEMLRLKEMSLKEAGRMLLKWKVGSLLVDDNRRYIGIITDTDILKLQTRSPQKMLRDIEEAGGVVELGPPRWQRLWLHRGDGHCAHALSSIVMRSEAGLLRRRSARSTGACPYRGSPP